MMMDGYDLFFKASKELSSVVSEPAGDAYRALGEVVSVYQAAFDAVSDHDLKKKLKKRAQRATDTRSAIVSHGLALREQLGGAVSTIDSLKRYRQELLDVENCAIEDGRRVRLPAPAQLLDAEERLHEDYDTYYRNVVREAIDAGAELTDVIDRFTTRIASHIEDVDEKIRKYDHSRTGLDVRWEDSMIDLYESDLSYAESLKEEWERRSGSVRKTICQVTIYIFEQDDERVRLCQSDDGRTEAAKVDLRVQE